LEAVNLAAFVFQEYSLKTVEHYQAMSIDIVHQLNSETPDPDTSYDLNLNPDISVSVAPTEANPNPNPIDKLLPDASILHQRMMIVYCHL
jgi:hypothetical protein